MRACVVILQSTSPDCCVIALSRGMENSVAIIIPGLRILGRIRTIVTVPPEQCIDPEHDVEHECYKCDKCENIGQSPVSSGQIPQEL